jgi:hypothetical protein
MLLIRRHSDGGAAWTALLLFAIPLCLMWRGEGHDSRFSPADEPEKRPHMVLDIGD